MDEQIIMITFVLSLVWNLKIKENKIMLKMNVY